MPRRGRSARSSASARRGRTARPARAPIRPRRTPLRWAPCRPPGPPPIRPTSRPATRRCSTGSASGRRAGSPRPLRTRTRTCSPCRPGSRRPPGAGPRPASRSRPPARRRTAASRGSSGSPARSSTSLTRNGSPASGRSAAPGSPAASRRVERLGFGQGGLGAQRDDRVERPVQPFDPLRARDRRANERTGGPVGRRRRGRRAWPYRILRTEIRGDRSTGALSRPRRGHERATAAGPCPRVLRGSAEPAGRAAWIPSADQRPRRRDGKRRIPRGVRLEWRDQRPERRGDRRSGAAAQRSAVGRADRRPDAAPSAAPSADISGAVIEFIGLDGEDAANVASAKAWRDEARDHAQLEVHRHRRRDLRGPDGRPAVRHRDLVQPVREPLPGGGPDPAARHEPAHALGRHVRRAQELAVPEPAGRGQAVRRADRLGRRPGGLQPGEGARRARSRPRSRTSTTSRSGASASRCRTTRRGCSS